MFLNVTISLFELHLCDSDQYFLKTLTNDGTN